MKWLLDDLRGAVPRAALLLSLAAPVTAAGLTLYFAADPAIASAQARERENVSRLNLRAMDQYANLEIDRAEEMLQEALAYCREHNITDTPLARTLINLGVIAIGGRGDNAAGLDYFVQALNADPNIELDPHHSSPDIQSMFLTAQQRHSAGGGSTAGGAAGGVGGGDAPRARGRAARQHAHPRLPAARGRGRCCAGRGVFPCGEHAPLRERRDGAGGGRLRRRNPPVAASSHPPFAIT